MKKIINPLGKSKLNIEGKLMTVIKYNSRNDITVKFNDGITVNTTMENFNKGLVYTHHFSEDESFFINDILNDISARTKKESPSTIIEKSIEEGKTFKEINSLVKNMSKKPKNFKEVNFLDKIKLIIPEESCYKVIKDLNK